MSYYYGLRGWLEVDPNHFPDVVRVIEEARAQAHGKDRIYLEGWVWHAHPTGWSAYVLYGADVTHEGLDLFKRLLAEICQKQFEVSGFFHAQGEDLEHNCSYRIINDVMTTEASAPICASSHDKDLVEAKPQ